MQHWPTDQQQHTYASDAVWWAYNQQPVVNTNPVCYSQRGSRYLSWLHCVYWHIDSLQPTDQQRNTWERGVVWNWIHTSSRPLCYVMLCYTNPVWYSRRVKISLVTAVCRLPWYFSSGWWSKPFWGDGRKYEVFNSKSWTDELYKYATITSDPTFYCIEVIFHCLFCLYPFTIFLCIYAEKQPLRFFPVT